MGIQGSAGTLSSLDGLRTSKFKTVYSQVRGKGLDCIFLDRSSRNGKALCSLYDLRPSQCRTWPFWSENVESPEAWIAASQSCPGINTGPTVNLTSIQACLDMEADVG